METAVEEPVGGPKRQLVLNGNQDSESAPQEYLTAILESLRP